MTDERIERVRNAIGQYTAWGIREGWTMYVNAPDDLDSLERELAAKDTTLTALRRDLRMAEEAIDQRDRDLTELREALKASFESEAKLAQEIDAAREVAEAARREMCACWGSDAEAARGPWCAASWPDKRDLWCVRCLAEDYFSHYDEVTG